MSWFTFLKWWPYPWLGASGSNGEKSYGDTQGRVWTPASLLAQSNGRLPGRIQVPENNTPTGSLSTDCSEPGKHRWGFSCHFQLFWIGWGLDRVVSEAIKGTPISWYWHWDKSYSILFGSFSSISIRHGQNIVGECSCPYTHHVMVAYWRWKI